MSIASSRTGCTVFHSFSVSSPAFLTENIGTLIQYVATIADKMPAQRKISDVQKNMNGTRTALPTVSASNMYAPTPTGNNSEDVGLRIMNSLTSK